MASSTALTTMSGLMPFSRLRASITLYSSLAIGNLPPYWKLKISTALLRLKLGNEVGLFHVGQINLQLCARFYRLVFLVLLATGQLEAETTVVKRLQASLKMPVAIDRNARHKLHPTAGEALEVGRLGQLPIQPRRRHFQGVGTTRHGIFDIKDRSHFAAEVRAIVVSHSPRFVDVDAQHAGLSATAQLHLDHFQTAGLRYPLGDFLDPV